MALSLAEKALLLLYGAPPQGPAQRSASNVLSDEAERGAYSLVIGALLADALLQRRIQLKRRALFIRCRPCYFVLTLVAFCLAILALLGPAIAAAAGLLSFVGGVALSIVLYSLWMVALLTTADRISGRLLLEETEAVTPDETLALLLEGMRKAGQGKTCQTYFRRLARFQPLREQAKRMRVRLREDGYVIVAEDASAGIAGTSALSYTMNLEQPECRRLLDQFRAFLLDGQIWDEESAILAILLCPRLVAKNPHIWPQPRWYAWFAPEEYPRLRVRLRAIKAQRDQTMRTRLDATTYQALLTIRNLLP